MRKLMISLDKMILDKDSAVARRMIEYGRVDELFIIIPTKEESVLDLSPTVHITGVGGKRLQQYRRLKKKGIELVRAHEIHFITAQDPSWSGNIGRWLKHKTGATLELQLHGDFYVSNFYKKHLKDFIGYFWFAKRNIRSADRIRVVSERTKKSAIDLGVDPRKIYVRAVPLNYYEPYKEAKAKSKFHSDNPIKKQYHGYVKIFLWGGMMEPVKNLDFLIDVFSDIQRKQKEFLLLLIGEGSQEERLKGKVKKLGLDNHVKFVRWVDTLTVYLVNVDCV